MVTIREKIIGLSNFQNLTSAEIASKLNLKENSVRSALVRYGLKYNKVTVKSEYEKNTELQETIKNVLQKKRYTLSGLANFLGMTHSLIDTMTMYMTNVAEDDNGMLFLV